MNPTTVFCSLLLTGALGASQSQNEVQNWLLTYERPAERPDWPESVQCWVSRTGYKYKAEPTDRIWRIKNIYIWGGVAHDYPVSATTATIEDQTDLVDCSLRFGTSQDIGHPFLLHLWHDGSKLPSAKSSHWSEILSDAGRKTLPFPLNITFTSEADVLQELALREVFNMYCYGLPRIDMNGWIAEGVPDTPPPFPTWSSWPPAPAPVPAPASIQVSTPAPVQTVPAPVPTLPPPAPRRQPPCCDRLRRCAHWLCSTVFRIWYRHGKHPRPHADRR